MEIRCTGIRFSVFSIRIITNIITADNSSGITSSPGVCLLAETRIPSKILTKIRVVCPPIPYFLFLPDSQRITITPVTISRTTTAFVRISKFPASANFRLSVRMNACTVASTNVRKSDKWFIFFGEILAFASAFFNETKICTNKEDSI